MDVLEIVAGALFIVWPVQYRHSLRRIRRRLEERGGDRQRFDRTMDRWWVRWGLIVSPIIGVVFVVVGATR